MLFKLLRKFFKDKEFIINQQYALYCLNEKFKLNEKVLDQYFKLFDLEILLKECASELKQYGKTINQRDKLQAKLQNATFVPYVNDDMPVWRLINRIEKHLDPNK